MKRTATRNVLSLLLALVLTVGLLPATTAAAAELPVSQHLQRFSSLDLTAPSVVYCKTNGDWATVSTTQNITDCQEGWTWYAVETDGYAAKTLILDGVYIGALATEGIKLPKDSHILLTEGSVNTIYVESFDGISFTSGIYCSGNLTVSTTGSTATLNATADTCVDIRDSLQLSSVVLNCYHAADKVDYQTDLYVSDTLTIDGGAIHADSGVGGLRVGYLSAKNCSIDAATCGETYSAKNAIQSSRGMWLENAAISAVSTGGHGISCAKNLTATNSSLTASGAPYIIEDSVLPGHGFYVENNFVADHSTVTSSVNDGAHAVTAGGLTLKNNSTGDFTATNRSAIAGIEDIDKAGALVLSDSTLTARTTRSGSAIQLGSVRLNGSTLNAFGADAGSALSIQSVLTCEHSTLNLTAGSTAPAAVQYTNSDGTVSLQGSTLQVTAPAGMGLSLSGSLTAKASDLQINSAKTALSAEGSLTLLTTTATLQSGSKTAISATDALSIGEETTPYNISGASVSGPLNGTLSTTTVTQTGSAPVVISPKAETRPVTVHKILPRTTQLNLDLQSTVTYQNIYGTTTTVDPLYNDITDCAEGWSWYCKPTGKYPARTLVLDGFTLELERTEHTDTSNWYHTQNHVLVDVGDGITVHLADGSVNTIGCHYDLDMVSKYTESGSSNPFHTNMDFFVLDVGADCALTGTGTLNVYATATKRSIYAWAYALRGGDLAVTDATLNVHVDAPAAQRISLNSLTVHNGSVEFSSSDDTALSLAELNLHGGSFRIPSGGSYGTDSLFTRNLTMTGGNAYLNDFTANYTDISGGALYGNNGYFADLTVSGGILNANCTAHNVNLTGGVTSGILRAYETIDIQDDACVIATEIAAQSINNFTPIKTVITMGTADKPLSVTNAKNDAGAVITSLSGLQSFLKLTGTDYPNPLIINPDKAPDTRNTSNWAAKEVQRAEDRNLLPGTLRYLDMKEDITREQFAMIAVLTYEALSGQPAPDPTGLENPFIDTDSPWVIQAYHLNLVTGMTTVRYEPTSTMTREQAATLLTRVYKRSTMEGWTLETDGNYKLTYTAPTPFADDAKIGGWAKNNVYFMAANKVINGVGGNRFDPKGTASVQEALIIALRIIDTFGK